MIGQNKAPQRLPLRQRIGSRVHVLKRGRPSVQCSVQESRRKGGKSSGPGECLSQAIARSCWLPSPTPPSDVSQSPLGEGARALHQGPRRQEQRWVLLQ